jgi:hypothetical protein
VCGSRGLTDSNLQLCAERGANKRKLEEEKVPQRKVQPDGLREGKKEQTQKAIDSTTDVDAMPSSGEHEHIEPHCHHKDIGCNEREKLKQYFDPTGNIYDINRNLIKGE